MPRGRHHQQSAVPEGDDECPTFAGEPARPVAPLDAPAVSQVDEPNVAMGGPARDPPDQLATKKTPPAVGLGEFQCHAVTGAAAVVRPRSSANCIAWSREHSPRAPGTSRRP